MAKEEDLRLGKMALERGMISRPQLEQALGELKEKTSLSLVETLVHKGYITSEQAKNLQKILGEQGRLGDYKLLQKLGEGGMGAVYQALHISSGEIRAVKVLSVQLSKDQEFVKRFLREAKASIAIDHPHVVRSFEARKSKTLYYMAMEYVEGRSLRDYIKEKGLIPEKEALRLCKQIASALAEAYNHGIIHRDIKPENILLTTTGDAKLADFGLVRLQGTTTITQTGSFMGTPGYISPEQAMGEKVDIRSDIYSLGITLYHMLTGSLPFESDNPLSVCHQQIHTPLPDPLEKAPHLSPSTVQLLRVMAAKNPEHRPQHPAELVTYIESLLQGKSSALLRKFSVQAKKVTRESKKIGRVPWRRWLKITAGVIFFLLFLAVVSNKNREKKAAVRTLFFSSLSKKDFAKARDLIHQNNYLKIKEERISDLEKLVGTFEGALKKDQWKTGLETFKKIGSLNLEKKTLKEIAPEILKSLADTSTQTLLQRETPWKKKVKRLHQTLPPLLIGHSLRDKKRIEKGNSSLREIRGQNRAFKRALLGAEEIFKESLALLKGEEATRASDKIRELKLQTKTLERAFELLEKNPFRDREKLIESLTLLNPLIEKGYPKKLDLLLKDLAQRDFPRTLRDTLALEPQRSAWWKKEFLELEKDYLNRLAHLSRSFCQRMRFGEALRRLAPAPQFIDPQNRQNYSSLRHILESLQGVWNKVRPQQRAKFSSRPKIVSRLLHKFWRRDHRAFYLLFFLERTSKKRELLKPFLQWANTVPRENLRDCLKRPCWPFNQEARPWKEWLFEYLKETEKKVPPKVTKNPLAKNPKKEPQKIPKKNLTPELLKKRIEEITTLYKTFESQWSEILSHYFERKEWLKLPAKLKGASLLTYQISALLRNTLRDLSTPQDQEKINQYLQNFLRVQELTRWMDPFFKLALLFRDSTTLLRTPLERVHALWGEIQKRKNALDSFLEQEKKVAELEQKQGLPEKMKVYHALKRECHILEKLYEGAKARAKGAFRESFQSLEFFEENHPESPLCAEVARTTRNRRVLFRQILEFKEGYKHFKDVLKTAKTTLNNAIFQTYRGKVLSRDAYFEIYHNFKIQYIHHQFNQIFFESYYTALMGTFRELLDQRETELAKTTALLIYRLRYTAWLATGKFDFLEMNINRKGPKDFLNMKPEYHFTKEQTQKLQDFFWFWEHPLSEGFDFIQKDLWNLRTIARLHHFVIDAKEEKRHNQGIRIRKLIPLSKILNNRDTFLRVVQLFALLKLRQLDNFWPLMDYAGDLEMIYLVIFKNPRYADKIKQYEKNLLIWTSNFVFPRDSLYFFVMRGDLRVSPGKGLYAPKKSHLPLVQILLGKGDYFKLTFYPEERAQLVLKLQEKKSYTDKKALGEGVFLLTRGKGNLLKVQGETKPLKPWKGKGNLVLLLKRQSSEWRWVLKTEKNDLLGTGRLYSFQYKDLAFHQILALSPDKVYLLSLHEKIGYRTKTK